MKTLTKFLLTYVFFSGFVFAIEFGKIDSTMQTNINTALHILQKLQKTTQNLQQDKANIEQAANEIFKLFDPIFDYNLMGQLALSQHSKTLTKEQIQSFHQAFEENLKRSFTDKLKLYKDENMQVIGGEKPRDNRYNLKTSIILDGKLNSIVFKFYENNAKDWKIYDVDILGISVIQTYRSQIDDLFTKSDFQTLLKTLHNEDTFQTKQ